MQMSDNMRGAALMALSMTGFTINDAFMKAVGQTLPLFQALLLRGIGATLLLVLLAHLLGQWRLDLPRADWGRMFWRALAEIVGAWTFISALFHMPIADVSAILQALPLTVTLASALFMGEVVGWRRMTAILIGFGGVLLIVRPGGEGFTIHAIYALICVLAVTLRDLVSRRLSPRTPSLMVAVTSALGVTAFAGIGSLFEDWQPVTPLITGQLLASMTFLIAGYVCSVAAMRVGEIGFVAPFRYTSLLVAIILGVLVFGTFPDGWTLVGSAIVIATGLFTLYRERLAHRRRAAAP
jgi:drug/metabolite transporter (DMT)-like permease